MKLSRRDLVKAGAAMSTLAGGSATQALASKAPVLVVYDSRHAESVAFAAGYRLPSLDVAAEHGQFWQGLRSSLPKGTVVGLTRWSELVIVRGYAEEQGKRLRHERKGGRYFAWELC